ncbi:MAG: hypothetical protein GYA24_02975 [Candidatus Lokiarchaeota archaeon]|nr:hypothetical protein [Candidatus Lokiarchaeota archaeon]
MKLTNPLRESSTRAAIQLVLAISLGIMANDVLLACIGSVHNIGMDDVPFLTSVLIVLSAGLVAGHVLRGRLPLVEWLSVTAAFACAGLYGMVKLGWATGDGRLAIACVLIGAYTVNLSLVDAFPGGTWLENRRGGLVDDGSILAIAIVGGALSTRAFITSPLLDTAWLIPAYVGAGAGVFGVLIIVTDQRGRLPRGVPPLERFYLAGLRGFLMGLGIVVFLAGSLETPWIIDELFGTWSMYGTISAQVIASIVLLAGLAGAPAGGAAAKACLLARRRPLWIVGAAMHVFGPMVACGLVLWASIVWDWLVAGVIALFYLAAHVAGLLLQFTDSGYKGSVVMNRTAA